MDDNRNFILAITLSVAVLVIWQVLFAVPEPPRPTPAEQQAGQPIPSDPSAPVTVSPSPVGVPSPVGATAVPIQTRDAAIASAPRIPVETPSIKGSISLRGGRIDEIVLQKYRVSTKPGSQNVVLFSPSGSPDPYYAEFGWVGLPGSTVKLPDASTLWTVEGNATLSPSTPVKLKYDNGSGLIFTRTIAVDENYLFTISQEVENKGAEPVAISPYALVSRHNTPQIEGFFIQHEGIIGVLGEEGLKEISYKDALEKQQTFAQTGGWFGFTDKYWAAVLIPDQQTPYQATLGSRGTGKKTFQADYLLNPITIAPGEKKSVTKRLFAGAKEVEVIDAYEAQLGIKKFELLIDWGWFHFITKPMFYVLDFFYKLVGNFGVSILIVTVLLKLAFFPLANKSYASMGKLKKLQPEMEKIRDRYKNDKMRQQQELMALYKKEKVNPMSGCLPILIQIPVFFALYKVLFITIEMRHAPFFGWIQDLSAPDPTSIFNLFGLLPYEVPSFLLIGVWPILMGITMWVQMKLNPTPTDPTQAMIFTWMPVLFTFMLASFPAGLVIYWTWNNLLSIIQQWIIMERNGVKVELLENMGLSGLAGKVAGMFGKPEPEAPAKPQPGGDRAPSSKPRRKGA